MKIVDEAKGAKRKKSDWKTKASTAQNQLDKSEAEMIVAQLIEETVGESGCVRELFLKMIKEYNAGNKPLGAEDAKRILFALVKQAVCERHKLTLRVVRSLEYGSHYQYYSGRIREIDHYTEDSYLAMKEMQSARSEYEHQIALLDKVLGRSFTRETVLDDSKVTMSSDKKMDKLREMNVEGGIEDDD